MSEVAVITGVAGQSGSYLAELLLEKGYRVHGVCRRSSVNNQGRVKHLLGNPNFYLVEGDVSDPYSIGQILLDAKPTEVYNLAAQSHVKSSFSQPHYTFQVDTLGVLNILEWIKTHDKSVRFYQASTSEMFGLSVDKDKYQRETTPLVPCSPYAVAKLAAHHLVNIYRTSYNIFSCSGILFNHESERRGEEFVTRKITKWLGEFNKWLKYHKASVKDIVSIDGTVYLGRQTYEQTLHFPKLRLGNLEAKRDFGHAEDYVNAMWMMLQHDKPDDYVVATGETHTIRTFLHRAMLAVGIPVEYHERLYVIDKAFYRPMEVEYLRGDSSKIRKTLGWAPEVSFDDLINRMVLHDSM